MFETVQHIWRHLRCHFLGYSVANVLTENRTKGERSHHCASPASPAIWQLSSWFRVYFYLLLICNCTLPVTAPGRLYNSVFQIPLCYQRYPIMTNFQFLQSSKILGRWRNKTMKWSARETASEERSDHVKELRNFYPLDVTCSYNIELFSTEQT